MNSITWGRCASRADRHPIHGAGSLGRWPASDGLGPKTGSVETFKLCMKTRLALPLTSRFLPPTERPPVMRTLTPGGCYLLYLCKGCNTRQVLFRDLNQGQSKNVAT